MNTDQNKAVVRAFDELGNGTGDPGRLDELCAPDIVNHALAPGAKPGIEGTRDFLQRARRDAHPARLTESHIVAEGDMVVQFGIREHEWQGGSFRGFDVPAGTYTRDTAFAYRIGDGHIAERWAIRDDLGMLLQLGALRDRE
jgi:ketosteroid isomerase-like protein